LKGAFQTLSTQVPKTRASRVGKRDALAGGVVGCPLRTLEGKYKKLVTICQAPHTPHRGGIIFCQSVCPPWFTSPPLGLLRRASPLPLHAGEGQAECGEAGGEVNALASSESLTTFTPTPPIRPLSARRMQRQVVYHCNHKLRISPVLGVDARVLQPPARIAHNDQPILIVV